MAHIIDLDAVTKQAVDEKVRIHVETDEFKNETRRVAAEAARQTVKTYVAGEEFRREARKEYRDQITNMIEGAEKKARIWAAFFTVLVLSIVGSLAFSEFLKVREKRMSLDEEFVKVYSTAEELTRTTARLKADTDRLQLDVQSKDKSVRASMEALEQKTKALEAQVAQASARVKAK